MRTVLRAAAGLVGGGLAGVVVTLGVVVARARIGRVFLHELGEVVGWTGLALVLAPMAGVWLALAWPWALGSTGVGAGAGLAVGAGLGAVMGTVGSADPAWAWAGGTMGAGVGLVAGALAGFLRGRRRAPTGEPGRSAGEPGQGTGDAGRAVTSTGVVVVLGAVVAFGAMGCGDGAEPELPPPGRFAEPAPEAVESVIFFLGDPGLARADHFPILPRLRGEVERWADVLEADSSVVVLVLGDLVYPDGVAARDSPGFAEDSARLADQVDLVAGPRARSRHARLHFLAGNHDWGQGAGRSGEERIHQLGALVEELGAGTGARVSLEPEAGTGGPSVVDVGRHVRLILLDTAWWLLEAEGASKRRVVRGVRRALRTAGDRRVVVAAHHPFESAGPHGALDVFGSTLGIRTLLSRSGALLQDLHSQPYRTLRQELTGVFAGEGRPDLFAGGHEHSLQVVRGGADDVPAVTLVSGSASKLTPVGTSPGLVFGRSAPGYARLFVKRDGTLELLVDAAPARFLRCPEEGDERETCMEEGVGAFRTVWAGELESAGALSEPR